MKVVGNHLFQIHKIKKTDDSLLNIWWCYILFNLTFESPSTRKNCWKSCSKKWIVDWEIESVIDCKQWIWYEPVWIRQQIQLTKAPGKSEFSLEPTACSVDNYRYIRNVGQVVILPLQFLSLTFLFKSGETSSIYVLYFVKPFSSASDLLWSPGLPKIFCMWVRCQDDEVRLNFRSLFLVTTGSVILDFPFSFS